MIKLQAAQTRIRGSIRGEDKRFFPSA